jgi:hypothetical protein
MRNLDEDAIRAKYKKLVEAGAIASAEECLGEKLTMEERADGTVVIEGPAKLLNVLRVMLSDD